MNLQDAQIRAYSLSSIFLHDIYEFSPSLREEGTSYSVCKKCGGVVTIRKGTTDNYTTEQSIIVTDKCKGDKIK